MQTPNNIHWNEYLKQWEAFSKLCCGAAPDLDALPAPSALCRICGARIRFQLVKVEHHTVNALPRHLWFLRLIYIRKWPTRWRQWFYARWPRRDIIHVAETPIPWCPGCETKPQRVGKIWW